MATIKSDAELNAQIDSVIKVNNNKEITPPLDNGLRKNIVASKLSIKDGGNVLQKLVGYVANLTPTDNKHLTPKKYVDDKLLATEIDTDGLILSQTWRSSITPSYTFRITRDDSGVDQIEQLTP